jgi:hypothetical protein
VRNRFRLPPHIDDPGGGDAMACVVTSRQRVCAYKGCGRSYLNLPGVIIFQLVSCRLRISRERRRRHEGKGQKKKKKRKKKRKKKKKEEEREEKKKKTKQYTAEQQAGYKKNNNKRIRTGRQKDRSGEPIHTAPPMLHP